MSVRSTSIKTVAEGVKNEGFSIDAKEEKKPEKIERYDLEVLSRTHFL